MVGSIFDKGTNPPGTIARLKVSPQGQARLPLGLTASEKQLSDIVDVGAGAQKKAQDMRKLDAYLRIFNSALKYFNGTATRYVPQLSKVEVEFIKPEKPSTLKIDA